MKLTAALELVVADLERRNLAAASIARFRDTLRRFLASTRKRSVARLRRADVEKFLALRSRTVSRAGQARDLGDLRTFFRALVARDLLDRSPTDGIDVRVSSLPATPLLAEEEVKAMLLAALVEPPPGQGRSFLAPAVCLRDRAVIEVLYGLGLRAAEVAVALVPDLDLAQAALVVRRAKRGRSRQLPLPPSVVAALERYMAVGRPALARQGRGRDEGRLFLTRFGTPFKAGWATRVVVRSVAARAGLKTTTHAFRRSVATHLIRQGASVRAVQELLGHKDLSTTARYVRLDQDDLRRAVDLLDH